jgi:hypothetical protein
MAEIFTNFVAGAVEDDPLSNIDFDQDAGEPEIVKLTAHTAASDEATIERGAQSTTGREHAAGILWSTAITKADADKWPVRVLTTTGDIIYASAANTPARLAGAAGVLHGAVGAAPSYSTIVAGDIASNAVTTAKILDSNVTTAKIADSNVTLDKMADNSVDTAELVDSAVETAKINDDAVTVAKIGGGAKGELISNSAASVAAWLAAGTDNEVLVHSDAESTGLKWGPDVQTWSSPVAAGITTTSGTTLAFYIQIGQRVDCWFFFALGASSAITAAIDLTLPVTAGSASYIHGTGRIVDASTGDDFPIHVHGTSTTVARLSLMNAAATYVLLGEFASNLPFTWTTSDTIAAHFSYRTA